MKIRGKMIADGEITETLLANGAVTNDKIDADAVTGDKVADTAIDSEHLVAGSIDASHLSQDAIDGVLEDKFLAAYSKEADVTAPSATTMIFGAEVFSAFQSGDLEGSVSKKGVVLSGVNNKARILDAGSNEPIEDASNRDVYGRLTTDKVTLSGSTVWANGSPTVDGSGTAFLSEVQADDLLIAPNGAIVKVQSVSSDIQLTLSANYTGENTSGETTVRHRITLSFYVDISGTETAHTMSGETIDVYIAESFEIRNLPFGSITTGVAYADGLPATHTHPGGEIEGLTATIAEINQVCDGVSANVTDTNLNTLTGGPSSDASSLHHHNGRYFTETEIGSTTASQGSDLVGYDNASRVHVDTATNVGDALDTIDSKMGSSGIIIQAFTAEAVTKGNAFVQTLTTAPREVAKVNMFVNGIRMRYGSGHDFTISGSTVTWESTADYDLDTNDEVIFEYGI